MEKPNSRNIKNFKSLYFEVTSDERDDFFQTLRELSSKLIGTDSEVIFFKFLSILKASEFEYTLPLKNPSIITKEIIIYCKSYLKPDKDKLTLIEKKKFLECLLTEFNAVTILNETNKYDNHFDNRFFADKSNSIYKMIETAATKLWLYIYNTEEVDFEGCIKICYEELTQYKKEHLKAFKRKGFNHYNLSALATLIVLKINKNILGDKLKNYVSNKDGDYSIGELHKLSDYRVKKK